MTPVHILLRLHPGYGLGDAVQMTAVVRHLKKARPGWVIDYQADVGRHSAMIGLVRNAFTYADAVPASSYNREIDIVLYDTFCAFTDKPNTRVTSCLHERFGLGWDPACARYQINITDQASNAAFEWLRRMQARWIDETKFRAVAVHYLGDSSAAQKNLSHEQAEKICVAILNRGRLPVLLDWRNQSPLPNGTTIVSPGTLGTANEWGRDAQMNAAIISQCEAFVGIDSGPGKCATATETPTLITWTGHHPALFHDPAPNTTHLVPVDHRQNPLLHGNAAVADWFEHTYLWRSYEDGEPVSKVKEWLAEILK